MKNVSFFIIILTIFLLITPVAQGAVDYNLLKDEYIMTHPGQGIIPYPWEPISSIKVLPFDYEIPAVPGNTLSMTASRNEFEPASFIITAQKDLTGITINVPDLYDAHKNTIPSSAIDIRLVKVWYQAAPNDIEFTTAGYYLTPELLLKDDSLVRVDYATRTNYLKVTINGIEQYVDISNPSGTFPSNAQIHDASSLQPFSLKANENKQIWVTVHVPNNAPTGNYYGNITITAPSETPITMNVSITVLPFDLEPAPIEYGLYYDGIISAYSGTTDTVGFLYKTPTAYSAELRNMKDHGVLYPTLYQEETSNLDSVLALRSSVGFPKDKIYLLGDWVGHDSYIGNAQDAAGLKIIADNVLSWKNHTKAHGYTDTYFYGMDEVQGDTLLSQRLAWQTVHNNGGKMYVAGYGPELIKMGDILDTAVVGWGLDPAQAASWHNYGHKILSYGNPQAGVENPDIYRKNYGFALWNAGYDGAMNFAYQYQFGQSIWNDFDDATYPRYRDHVFAYPVTDGVIDTIQWEGFREGVDDTRYVASLIKKEGSMTSAKAIISAGLSNNENMTIIRKNVIDQILLSQVNRAPVLAAIGNKSAYAGSLLTFTISAYDPNGNSLTYSATNLPANATFNPTTRTFAWTPAIAQVGTSTISFSITDGSLSDSESVWITTSDKAVQPTPKSSGTMPVVIVALLGLALYAQRFWKK
jgi:hypothetical protein